MELRTAVRALLRRPGFTTVAVATVAVGIGAATAVFGVVHGILLKPLPYPAPDRMYYLWERTLDGSRNWVSGPAFEDWRDGLRSFAHVAAMTPGGFNASGSGGPERLRGVEVTPGFFGVLGLTFSQGRDFLEEEGTSPTSRVAVISDALWRRQFGGNTSVLSQTLDLDGTAYTVVGVVPAGHEFPAGVDVWVPLDLRSESWKTRRGIQWLNVIGRLRPGVTPEAATQEMDALGKALVEQHPELREGWSVAAVPFLTQIVGGTRTPLLILMVAVGLVLLAVCVNLAGLFLVRAAGRRKEAAIRISLGSSRFQLARQFLSETMLLSLAGGALGLIAARVFVRVLQSLAPAGTPRIADAELSPPVLAFGFALSLLVGLLTAVAPALRAAGEDPRAGLREGSDGRAGRAPLARHALVIAQVGLAVVLAVGTAHLQATFLNLRHVDPGFDTHGVLTASLPLTETRYETKPQIAAFYDELLSRVRAHPNVESAGVVSLLPLSGNSVNFSFELRDRTGVDPDQWVAGYQSASPGYFEAMSIPLLRGRSVGPEDNAESEPVIIVDQAFADRFFAGKDPLGQEVLAIGDQWRRVIGVVGSVKRSSLRRDPQPLYYVPHAQDPRFATLVVRVRDGDALGVLPDVRRIVSDIDPAQPIALAGTLESLAGANVAQPRFTATVVGFFAVATLFLAVLSVYGIVAAMVERRTRELGIRLALGARAGQLRRMVLRHGINLAAVGLLIGIGASIPAMRLIQSVLFGVGPFELRIVLAVAIVLASAAVAACWVPARRATRVDPALSLRWD